MTGWATLGIVLCGLGWFAYRWRLAVRRAGAWRELRCAVCGYDLRGSPSGVCPECGHFNASVARLRGTALVSLTELRRHRQYSLGPLVLIALLVALGALVWMLPDCTPKPSITFYLTPVGQPGPCPVSDVELDIVAFPAPTPTDRLDESVREALHRPGAMHVLHARTPIGDQIEVPFSFSVAGHVRTGLFRLTDVEQRVDRLAFVATHQLDGSSSLLIPGSVALGEQKRVGRHWTTIDTGPSPVEIEFFVRLPAPLPPSSMPASEQTEDTGRGPTVPDAPPGASTTNPSTRAGEANSTESSAENADGAYVTITDCTHAGEWMTFIVHALSPNRVQVLREKDGEVQQIEDFDLPAGCTSLIRLAQSACAQLRTATVPTPDESDATCRKLTITLVRGDRRESTSIGGAVRDLSRLYHTDGPLHDLLELVSRRQPKGYRFVYESGPARDEMPVRKP